MWYVNMAAFYHLPVNNSSFHIYMCLYSCQKNHIFSNKSTLKNSFWARCSRSLNLTEICLCQRYQDNFQMKSIYQCMFRCHKTWYRGLIAYIVQSGFRVAISNKILRQCFFFCISKTCYFCIDYKNKRVHLHIFINNKISPSLFE